MRGSASDNDKNTEHYNVTHHGAPSVLNLDCRAPAIDNLYVTDASFFPAIGAVNPALTIITNALRGADIINIGW